MKNVGGWGTFSRGYGDSIGNLGCGDTAANDDTKDTETGNKRVNRLAPQYVEETWGVCSSMATFWVILGLSLLLPNQPA